MYYDGDELDIPDDIVAFSSYFQQTFTVPCSLESVGSSTRDITGNKNESNISINELTENDVENALI